MNTPTITSETTIEQAVDILKQKVDQLANSEEAAQFSKDNPHWSTLFCEAYPPFNDAVKELESALELNEWLNGKNPENGKLTIKQAFINLNERDRLSLFHKRVNSKIPTLFDEYLQMWWMNRY